jgi:nitric oxide reductase NorQ protein
MAIDVGGVKHAREERSTNGAGEDARLVPARLRPMPRDRDFYIAREVRDEVDRLLALAEQSPIAMAIVGPHGAGKSALAMQIAARRGGPVALIAGHQSESSREWFGQRELVAGETVFRPSLFAEALETPGATIILNDLPRMSNRAVQNALFNVLDGLVRREHVDALGRELRVADRVLIIATWNEGWAYSGNIRMDQALIDRFSESVIWLGYPPADVMVNILRAKTGVSDVDAMCLVRYAERLRASPEQHEVSLRGMLAAARKAVAGADLRDAVRFSIVNSLPGEAREAALAGLEADISLPRKRSLTRASRGWEQW